MATRYYFVAIFIFIGIMLVFLVGMMGSGKSTIGRLLAEELQLSFYDTDDILESLEDMKVSEIFAKHGEVYFRNAELELIRHWKLSNAIVATGGGLPCHDDLIDKLNGLGKTFYLMVPIDTLVQRLHDQDDRPLLADKSTNEIKKTLLGLLKDRKEKYQKANFRMKCDGPPDKIMRKIISKIYQ